MERSAIEIPEDLWDFVQEQLRSGQYASASDVIRDALSVLRLRQERLSALRSALAIGIEQLDAGDVVEGTPAELMQALRESRPFGQ